MQLGLSLGLVGVVAGSLAALASPAAAGTVVGRLELPPAPERGPVIAKGFALYTAADVDLVDGQEKPCARKVTSVNSVAAGVATSATVVMPHANDRGRVPAPLALQRNVPEQRGQLDGVVQ